ncbi:SET domain containing protein [Acanthamoeba castellanii str. Neff]|uniref:SET domain containing protein n=1 Tax=Acanthamoeba castellanii (strain ATCC 30010 / Neff) TaxID=1257118 RepID=L8HBW5_ACACF|nr:SET domain containing protein [Acanthamoeba castellanii str. Neff]ELR22218.1 SET domain containing protein [Acanthamoeba castellanii str. Neff]
MRSCARVSCRPSTRPGALVTSSSWQAPGEGSEFEPEVVDQFKRAFYDQLAGGPNSPVMIADVEGRGRAIVARHNITKGQLITAEKPFVSYLSERVETHGAAHPPKPTRCDHCMRGLPPAAAKAAQHNNPAGLLLARYHEAICELGKEVREMEIHCSKDKRKFPLLAMRTMARILLNFRDTGSLDATWVPLQVLGFAKQKPELWTQDYDVFKRCFIHNEDQADFFSYEWYCRMMQIFYINSVSVTMDSTQQNVGAGLYILSSFYNHSCVPNTRSSYPENNTWHVYASKPIEAGQEIFISYVDHMKSNKTVETRRQHLYNHYGFWCECPRCRLELDLARREQGPA